jgi:4-hydroxybenzoate polyprenyltransferase
VTALIVTYPFMKRVTYWPQFFLGLNFNWGAIMGWAAARGDLRAPALWLYLGGIAWTLGYDTIYAHQDKDDDLLIGVKSSALALGSWTRPFLFIFYALAVILWAVAGQSAGLGWPYRAALVCAALQLFWQATKVDTASQPDCSAKFRSNRWTGWILLVGIIAAHVL